MLYLFNKPVCNDLAKNLESSVGHLASYNLHLRSASLSNAEAKLFSEAIKSVHKDATLSLLSFSFSYNPDIKQSGLSILLDALPDHITELGLVGCNLDDLCDNSIISFLSRSKN
jgi:hypothetical protein